MQRCLERLGRITDVRDQRGLAVDHARLACGCVPAPVATRPSADVGWRRGLRVVARVEVAPRDGHGETRHFFGPDGLRQRHARNLERVGNVLRHRRENAADVDAALAGELPLVARRADDAGHRRRHFLRGVADVREAEPFARQRGELLDARVGAAEVEHVDEDSGVAPVHRPHDLGRLGQVARLGPVRKLEARRRCRAACARSHSRANRAVVRSRSGSGNWAMM